MPWDLLGAKNLVDKGLAYALSVVFIFAVVIGLLLFYRWAKLRIDSQPHPLLAPPTFRPCDGCTFADDYRSPDELIGHRIFGYIRLARASLLPNLPIPDAGRRHMLVDLLDARFRLVSDLYLEWLKIHLPTLEAMRSDTLASEQLALVGAIVEAFESEGRRLGVPNIVLERLRYWDGPRVGHLRTEIQLVCESEWITDSPQRLGFIMSVMEQVLKATVLDAERTLGALNGQLTGIVYHGITVGPCAQKDGSGAKSRPELLRQGGS